MRNRKLLIGLVISAVCLVLALAGIEWRRAAEALRRADWRYLLPASAALLAYLVARAVRWRILLGTRVALIDAFAVTNVGYLISNVLPFRLGDPARAVAISLKGKVRVSAAFSTVIVERVLDMLVVVLLLAVTTPFVQEAGWTRSAGLVGGVLALLAMGVLVTLGRHPDWGRHAFGWVGDRVPGIGAEEWQETFEGLLDGLNVFRSRRRALALMVGSIVTWILTVGYYLAMLHAFLVRPSVVQASFLTCATGLGMALPSSPGAVGVFHSVARYALQLPFGVTVETAVVAAFASHAFQYVIMTILGLIGLMQQNLSLARLRTNAATVVKE